MSSFLSTKGLTVPPTTKRPPLLISGDAHPVAELFPLLEGDAFEELKADIRENGLRVPIVVTSNGVILDGRNRWRACQAVDAASRDSLPAKSRLQYEVVDLPAASQADFVLSLNVHRRHLTTGQRAMLAARLRVKFGYGQAECAAIFSVSVSTLKHAEAVLDGGDADLIASVDGDCVKVSAAAETLRKRRAADPARREERARQKAAKEQAKRQREATAARLVATAVAEPLSIAEAPSPSDDSDLAPIGRQRLPGSSGEVLSLEGLLEPVPACSCDLQDDYWQQAVGFDECRRLVSRAHRLIDHTALTAGATEYLARKALLRIPAERREGFLAMVRHDLLSS